MSTPSADMSNPANALPAEEGGRFALARALAKRQGLFSTTRRKLVAALIASIVLHAIFGAFIESEPPEEAIVPLKAQFMKLPPPPTAQTSVAQAKPKPKPKRRPTPEANAAVAALPATEPVVAQNEPAPEKAPEPTAEPEPAPTKEEPIAEKLAEVETKADEPPVPTIDPSKLPPRKIQLGYTVFLGENKSELGPVQLNFTHENGRYKMRITGRVRGLAAVFYPGIYQGESEGVITEEGLRPDKFIEERGSPDKRREALFDHVNKKSDGAGKRAARHRRHRARSAHLDRAVLFLDAEDGTHNV